MVCQWQTKILETSPGLWEDTVTQRYSTVVQSRWATTLPYYCTGIRMFRAANCRITITMLRVFLLLVSAASGCALPNVLYILSDDMRADIGAYGLPTVTPNLDALAASGLRFTHSFCQISVCSPSRQSFLTGRRPDRSGVWNFIDANPLNVSSIPRHFRDAGYLTIGAGKTFHEDSGAWNAANVWSNNSANVPWYFEYGSNTCPHGGEGGGQCALTPKEESTLL
jgi:hypothetical protein